MSEFTSKRKISIADVMSALSETISSQREMGTPEDPTPTELFVLISITLASGGAVEHLSKVLKIYSVVLPQAAIPVLRSQFKTTLQTLMRIIHGCPNEPDVQSLALNSLGSLLIAQELSEGQWSSSQSLQGINVLLAFIDESRSLVRKTATSKLSELLSLHKNAGCKVVRNYFSDFCIEIMKTCCRSEYKRSLYIILFLEGALYTLSEPLVCKICACALKLQHCGQPLLTSAIFRMFDALFQNRSKVISSENTQHLLHLLVENRPETSDMESIVFYCNALSSALVALRHADVGKANIELISVSEAIVAGCNTDFTQIHCAVMNSLKRVLIECIDDVLVSAAVTERKLSPLSSSSVLNSFLSIVSTLLHLRFQSTWPYVLDFIDHIFDRFRGDTGCILLGDVFLSKLVSIYEASLANRVTLNDNIQEMVLKSLGAALRSIGVFHFLSIIPFTLPDTEKYLGLDPRRYYLLPLLCDNIKLMRCELADFGRSMLPVAKVYSNALKAAKRGDLDLSKSQLKGIRSKVVELWSLFPLICLSNPPDVTSNFQKLATILDAAMSDDTYPELIVVIISGLTNLANSMKTIYPHFISSLEGAVPEDLKVLQAYSITFFPMLLSLFDNADPTDMKFHACIQCITSWSFLTKKSLLFSIAKKLLQQLLVSTGNLDDSNLNDKAARWMSILLALVPFLSKQLVVLLYKTIRPLLTLGNSISLQKRAYTVLDALLISYGDDLFETEPKLQMLAMLTESLLTCNVSARHIRLRCMRSVVASINDVDELTIATNAIIGEVLICQKDANAKTREAAIQLLDHLLISNPPETMFVVLCSALAGETVVMRSSSLVAICRLLIERRDNIDLLSSACSLLPTILLLFQEECVEQSRAVLGFVRVCTNVVPTEWLMEFSTTTLTGIFGYLGSLKAKFTSRIRAILRKLIKRSHGSICFRSIVPVEDIPLLDYLEKEDRRTVRKNASKKSMTEKLLGSDSEDSDADDNHDGAHAEPLDYRLAARPKATRVVGACYVDQHRDFTETGEENENGVMRRPRVKVRAALSMKTSEKEETASDEDDDYTITLSPSGQVVLTKKEKDIQKMEISNASGTDVIANDHFPKQEIVEIKKRVREAGSEYRSKKAGGDVWKSGMLQPHAYIPLDPRLLSKSNTDNAVSVFGSVVKSGKKGRGEAEPATKRSRHGQVIIPGNRKQRLAKQKSRV